MCGIVSIINKKFNDNLTDQIKSCLDLINHRGPDNRGFFCKENIGIGMTRLSIIDLNSGNQPIFNLDKSYAIVFNGEVYNFINLKKNLENVGVKFKTNSDTEVFLNGYLNYGEDFFNKVEGMFCAILFDIKKKKIKVVRDRLGKKPLYYYEDNEKIILCSETYPIYKLCKKNLEIDYQSYWDFLTFRYIPSTSTSFLKIKKIKPGCFYEFSPEKITYKKYWQLKPFSNEYKKFNHEDSDVLNFNEKNIQKVFSKTFQEAVKKRLISDVPVGVLLSGGIDSAAVLFEASKYKQIDSFHVAFTDQDINYNELRYAKYAAKFLKSNLHVVEINDNEFIDQLFNIGTITDQPLSDLSAIPFNAVCKLAKDNKIKVLLSGEGSDEVLGGYGFNKTAFKLDLFNIINKRKKIFNFLILVFKKLFKNKLLNLNEFNIDPKIWPSYKNYNITYQADQSFKAALLNNSIKNFFLDSSRYLKKLYNETKSLDPINDILYVIMHDWLQENVFMKSDKVSMYNSIEIRCPFVDHKLVEFLFKIPSSEKIKYKNFKYVSKYILKKYLESKLPYELINQKKKGFPVPAYKLDKKKYKDFVFDILNYNSSFYKNIFNYKKIMNLFEDTVKNNDTSENNKKHFLWSIVTFEIWLRNIKNR